MQTFSSLIKCQEQQLTEDETRSAFINNFYNFIFDSNLEIIDYIVAQNDKEVLIRQIESRWNYKIIFLAVQTFFINGNTAKQEEMLCSLLKLGFIVHIKCDELYMPLRYCIRVNMFRDILSKDLVEKTFEIATLLFQHGHEMMYHDAMDNSSLYSLFMFATDIQHFNYPLSVEEINYLKQKEAVVKKLSKRMIIFLLNNGYDCKKINKDDEWYQAFLENCCTDELIMYCLSYINVNIIL